MRRGRLRAILLGGGLLAAPALVAAWFAQREAAPLPATAALGSPERCAAYGGLPPGWLQERRAGMTRIGGGLTELGSLRGYADERPLQHASLQAFWIDRTEVSNAQFAAFVAASGHVTQAERLGGGMVFVQPAQDAATGPLSWWQFRAGADWRHPEGPGSSLAGRANQPVVQVTRADALAYARWLGRDLPDEAEWETAAKAGRRNLDADTAVGKAEAPQANFWQGNFPYDDEARDRYAGRAPVGCFAANPYGLHDAIGNVWEWTRDDYSGARQPHGHGDAGGDPAAQTAVIKGGSYLCAANFCVRYRASARHPQEAGLPTSHVGFRTVLREASPVLARR